MIDDSTFKTLQVTRHDNGVLEVVIAHPDNDLNLVDWQLWTDVNELFSLLRSEFDARVVLLTARGQYFSGGGHHSGIFASLHDSATARERLRIGARKFIPDLIDLHLPLVVAVNGPAVGWGVFVSLLGDVIFASEDAYFSDPHVKRGISTGSTAALYYAVLGPARARHYMFTGERLTAADAERFGLINFVLPKDEVHAAAFEYAANLAAQPPLALAHTKALFSDLVRDLFLRINEQSIALEMSDFTTDDHSEAIAAFAEKRPATYFGR